MMAEFGWAPNSLQMQLEPAGDDDGTEITGIRPCPIKPV